MPQGRCGRRRCQGLSGKCDFAYVGNSDGILTSVSHDGQAIWLGHLGPIQTKSSSYFVSETPAMAAGVTSKLWEMSDMVKVLEDWKRWNEISDCGNVHRQTGG